MRVKCEIPQGGVHHLKCIYGKAHPRRDWETRQEDPLRRFLDALLNEVEYVKSPTTIDEAVNEVVIFPETRKKGTDDNVGDRCARKYVCAVQSFDCSDGVHDSASDCAGDEGDRVARVPGKGSKSNHPGHKVKYSASNGQKVDARPACSSDDYQCRSSRSLP